MLARPSQRPVVRNPCLLLREGEGGRVGGPEEARSHVLDAGLCQGTWAAAVHGDGGGTLGIEPADGHWLVALIPF